MRVNVSSDVERFTRDMDEAGRRHIPFALARALTMTAKDSQADVRSGLSRKFTLRNAWVSGGIRITPATKTNPVAVVGSLEPFMALQETGGPKHSKTGHRLTPPKDKPKSIIPKGRRAQAVRNKKGVFVTATKYGAGIFWRPSEERYPIVALYWLKRGVQVKPRLGFKGTTAATIGRRFASNFVAALSDAMGHTG